MLNPYFFPLLLISKFLHSTLIQNELQIRIYKKNILLLNWISFISMSFLVSIPGAAPQLLVTRGVPHSTNPATPKHLWQWVQGFILQTELTRIPITWSFRTNTMCSVDDLDQSTSKIHTLIPNHDNELKTLENLWPRSNFPATATDQHLRTPSRFTPPTTRYKSLKPIYTILHCSPTDTDVQTQVAQTEGCHHS